jgi:hypothetical protein
MQGHLSKALLLAIEVATEYLLALAYSPQVWKSRWQPLPALACKARKDGKMRL